MHAKHFLDILSIGIEPSCLRSDESRLRFALKVKVLDFGATLCHFHFAPKSVLRQKTVLSADGDKR